MAEIVVQIVDKVNKDFYLNCGCYKRGDVIEIREDGFPWGKIDRSNPDWRIIKLPQYSVKDLESFRSGEKNTDPTQPSKTLQRRAFKFDIDNPNLPQDIKSVVSDASRTMEKTTVDSAFNIYAFKVEKAKIEDPAIIGTESSKF
jgi:hypothetical protein